MPTLKDVAKKAEVSTATVSNYINGTKFVTPATSQKIQAVIDDLGFTLNSNARKLKLAGRSNEIAVVMPNTYDSYYTNILAGLEKELIESGYSVNLSLSGDIPEKEINILTRVLARNICGLIIVTSLSEDTTFFDKYFFSNNIPVVFISRKISNPNINFLSFDNYKTITALLEELHVNNYVDIAIVVGQKEYFPENECVRAYEEFFSRHQLKLNPNLIARVLPSKESAFRTGVMLINLEKPKVVIASSQQIGKGLAEAANLIGLHNPDEFRIISLGEENWISSSLKTRNISTMRASHKLGQEAANTIIANINSPIIFEKNQIAFEDKIVQRGIFSKKNNGHLSNSHDKQPKVFEALLLSTSDSDAVETLAFDFENKTGIKVNVTTLPQDTLINTIFSGDNSIIYHYDIFMYDITWASQLAHIGALTDITAYVKSDQFDDSIFIDDCMERISVYNGKYYGLPFIYSPQLLLYRKDLFSDPAIRKAFKDEYKVDLAPPKTWMMFNAIAKFFTKSFNPQSPTEYGTSLAGGMTSSMMPEFYSRLWAYGGDFFKNGKPDYHSPASIKALASYKESYNYASPNALSSSIEDTVTDFHSGKIAILVSYASYITHVTNPAISKIIGKIGYDYVPGENSVLGCWALGISSQCEHPTDAFNFLSWACGEEMSNYFTILDGQSPVTQIYQNDELVNLYPWLPLIYNCYPKCRDRITSLSENDNNIHFLEVERMTHRILRKMFDEGISPHQTALDIQSKIESIL